jgi:hypothetical protein
VNVCRNGFRRIVGIETVESNKCLKTLERVKRSDSNSAIRITIIYHRVR